MQNHDIIIKPIVSEKSMDQLADRKYTFKVAMISALSAKCAENEIIVVDNLNLDEIKTKKMAQVLKNLKVESKALIVTNEKNDNVVKSARNIAGVATTFMGSLNVYDILKYDVMVISKDAVSKIEEVYA